MSTPQQYISDAERAQNKLKTTETEQSRQLRTLQRNALGVGQTAPMRAAPPTPGASILSNYSGAPSQTSRDPIDMLTQQVKRTIPGAMTNLLSRLGG